MPSLSSPKQSVRPTAAHNQDRSECYPGRDPGLEGIKSNFLPANSPRFLLVKHLQKLPKPVLLTLGMSAMGLSALCPSVSMTAISIIFSGALYGFGYAFVGPNVIVSVGQFFAPTERPRAVALTNTFFQAGSVLAPVIAGHSMSAAGTVALPLFMSAIGAGAITMAALI